MKISIYPGSFDPITNGHLDIIKRASSLTQKLYVAVARNRAKEPLFSVEERVRMLKECCIDFANVEVVSFSGLLIDFCRKKDISIIVRGLRATVDFEYEYAVSLMNKRLADDIETVFLMASSEHSFVSSRIVKEVAANQGDISTLVPDSVIPSLMEKIR